MTDYEIEELESQINKACFVPVFKNGANIGYRIESDPRRIAEHLVVQGYRKETDAQREAAKDIRDMLLERLDTQENMLVRFELAAMIAKIETVFGLEV